MNVKLLTGMALACFGLAACGDQPGTPEPGTGAAGFVTEPGAGAAEGPPGTPGNTDGMVGQTPAWTEPGGAPSQVTQGPAAPVSPPPTVEEKR